MSLLIFRLFRFCPCMAVHPIDAHSLSSLIVRLPVTKLDARALGCIDRPFARNGIWAVGSSSFKTFASMDAAFAATHTTENVLAQLDTTLAGIEPQEAALRRCGHRTRA